MSLVKKTPHGDEHATSTLDSGTETTVILAEQGEPDCAEAIEQMLVGFGHGNLQQVQEAIQSMGRGTDMEKLSGRVSELLADFHSSISTVKGGFDPASITMNSTNIPDAARKLEYVLNATNEASHKLFLLVERQENLLKQGDEALKHLTVQLQDNVPNGPALEAYAKEHQRLSAEGRELLSEIVMTQEFQDLCGQALKKVLKLVESMEGNLATLLKYLGVSVHGADSPAPPSMEDTKVGQDNVDDLLKQFGF